MVMGTEPFHSTGDSLMIGVRPFLFLVLFHARLSFRPSAAVVFSQACERGISSALNSLYRSFERHDIAVA